MSETTSTASRRPAIDVANDFDGYISRQITLAGNKVRWTDLATLFVELLSGIIGFLLVVIIIDHWFVDLGFWGRIIAQFVLVLGAASFVFFRIVPYIVRRVNPMYAAKTLEQSTPALRNSLINFLLLRSRPDEVRPAVFDAVRQRAASDLSIVHVDSAIDRGTLIRFGYILSVLVTIAGAYQIFSPKDPLASVARIVMPWRQIARPSRVQILEVTPGDVEIYRGESVNASANVLGVGRDDPVTLTYSTDDKQLVDVSIEMARNGDRDTFLATIGDSTSGLQQGIRYRISAGDAVSADFRVTVVEAPNILVRQVDYEYPAYTSLSPESRSTGDIIALEGTRVTVRAQANQAMRAAQLELFAPKREDAKDADAEIETLPMSCQDREAVVSFTLALEPDRKTPRYVAYQIRFTNTDGQKNPQPTRHAIDVVPDLAPHVDILTPSERDTEVPENGSLPFEVRAIDPDFQLQELILEIASGGEKVASVPLLEKAEGGQVTRKYNLRPMTLGLRAGDIAVVWATAQDNHRSAESKTEAGNRSRTENYRVRILPAERQQPPNEEPSDKGATGESQSPEPGSDPQQGEKSDSEGQQGPESSDGQPSENGSSDQPSDQAADGKSSPENDQANEGQKGAESKDRSSSGNSGNKSDGKGTQSDPQSKQDAGSEKSPFDSSSPNDNGKSDTPKSDGTSQSGKADKPSDENKPVASDGSQDSEAIQKILDDARDKSGEQEQSQAADKPGGEQSNGSRDANSKDQSTAGSDRSRDRTEKGDQQSKRDPTSPRSKGDKKPTDDQPAKQPLAGEPGSEEKATGGADGKPRAGQDSPSKGSGESGASDEATEKSGGKSSDKNENEGQQGMPSQGKSDGSKDKASGDAGDQSESAADKSNEPGGDATSDAEPEITKPDGSGQEPARDPDKRSPSQSSQKSNSGEQPTGQPSDSTQDGGKPANGESSSANPNQAPGSDRNSPAQGSSTGKTSPSGGNDPGGEPGDQSATNGEVMKADDPNLEYAKKATDIALEHLKNDADNRQLLDKLGWTPAEAQAFIKRWESLKKDARENDPRGQEARRELDDSLRGLGLRPQDSKLRRNASILGDSERRVSETARQSQPPAEYLEQYRAYLKQGGGRPGAGDRRRE